MSAETLQLFLQLAGLTTTCGLLVYAIFLRDRVRLMHRRLVLAQKQIDQLQAERYTRFFNTPDGFNG